MTKLIIALFAVAAVVAWAWLCRRKRDEETTATAPLPTAPPETVEEKPVEAPDEVVVPVTKAEVSPQNPLSVPEVASDFPAPATSELQPTPPDSGDTISGQPEGISPPATVQPDALTITEAPVSEGEQPTPPPIIIPTKPDVRQEIPTHSRPTKIAKPEAARHIAPERRGGGQMETEESGQPAEQRKRVRSGPQLRLICFRGNDRLWRLAVELPEDFSAGGDIEVSQDGQPLERAGFNENRWPLRRLDGSVAAAEKRNGGQRWQLEIDSDECLLFKLLEDSETEEGRLVSALSRGEYLVIAPEDWPMPESSGIQLSRERNVSVDGHVGYRFIVRDGVLPKLEFGQRGSQRRTIQFRTACFTLAGERADAMFSEYQSPLFLKSPPRVRATEAESWSCVQKVVLGVAGKGRNRWKFGFKPNPTNNEVPLSEHLNGRKGGWYFVRLYDANEVLMDSLYFAFAKTLLGIRVSGASVLPAADGHGEARLEFEHDANATVEILGEHKAEALTCGTAFIVPARCEQVNWQIGWPGEPALKCTTRIEKIWWALVSEGQQPPDSDWTDKPVTGKRADFFAASDKVLLVRLPCTNSMDRFFVGFTLDAARPYLAIAEQRNVPIRLRDFAASNQVQSVGVTPFSIWLWQNEREVFAQALHLEIALECCFCAKRFSTDDEALAHAVEHEKEFIRELSYDELRRLNPELPAAIFQCSHSGCRFYAREDDPSNATSVITRHIEETHRTQYGPAHISFRSVTDLDEIRRNVERHLPHIFRCKCGERFENVQAEDFAEHIFCKHRSQLFNLV
ncbi:MAG: hypothetical protein L0Z50_32660 [Verrucomicrobiales bacterium]|nr:hypothetical protein [Verrucomicrobiales bacterium]